MSGLILFILFIWLVVAVNKKKKPQAKAAKPVPPMADWAFKPESETRVKVTAARNRQPQVKKPVERKTAVKAAEETEGFAHADAPRSIDFTTGSMPAATIAEYVGEGEAPEEHAEHLEAMHEADEKRRMRREEKRELRSMGRRQLRSAVIMSEILDRPVSMRTPRY